jgi:hypothetical protein
VNGGPVDERRRREPRARRFQSVESTSVVEQPSSFAGWRSVGSLGRCGSKVAERFVSPTTDKPSRHFSSASDPTVTTRGARREKRRGLHHVVAGDIELASAPALKARDKRNFGNVTVSLQRRQPLLVPSARTSFSPPQEGGFGLRNQSTTRSSLLSHSKRKLATREKLVRGSLERARGLARSRACPCVVRSTVAEVVGPCVAQVVFTLSRGERRRSLTFHFTNSSQSHRKGVGSKELATVKGENARSRGAQAHRKM